MLGVKCTAFRYTASGRQYCDETAGGLAPANTAKTPWRAAAARVGGSGGGLSAPTKSPQLDYDDELFFEGNKVRRVLSPLPAQARPHAALRLFLADLLGKKKREGITALFRHGAGRKRSWQLLNVTSERHSRPRDAALLNCWLS